MLDNKLNKIGETECLSKGEKMYSTRFLGEKSIYGNIQKIQIRCML